MLGAFPDVLAAFKLFSIISNVGQLSKMLSFCKILCRDLSHEEAENSILCYPASYNLSYLPMFKDILKYSQLLFFFLVKFC